MIRETLILVEASATILRAVLLSLSLFFAQCAPLNVMVYSNLAYLYDPEEKEYQLECIPYHIDPDITELFFRFRYADLLFEKEPGSDEYQANFSIRYELFNAYDNRMLIDSGQRIYAGMVLPDKELPFISSIPLKTVFPGVFLVNLTLSDFNRSSSYTIHHEIKKLSVFSQQNFLLSDGIGNLLFQPYLAPDQEFRLMYNKPEQPDLYVRHYTMDSPVADPPFLEGDQVSLDLRTDSLFRISLIDGETGMLVLPDEGLYFFQADTIPQEGFTVFRFYDGYPLVDSPEQMSYPLRYLTTKKEYERIQSHPNRKEAVEDFWLKSGGNPDRAIQMIRKYYTGVEEANRLFTSWMEGWKTDRGMIYVIFGKPTVVYRNADAEQWIYGQEGNVLSITFNFEKVVNPFTENDYRLDRSAAFKEPWYMAVEGWRR
ncbi:MAG: GWxTD domain-containing protein [Bacteroidales bacterium]|nr:GWxTD domain-containing protein [Bacteroidales bacterium]